jgi:hypothetical protein
MNPAEFFITLLHAATVAHVLHLQTRSYAQHKALDSFYKELPDLVDNVIEAYQGKNNKIVTDYPAKSVSPQSKNPLEFLQWLSTYVEKNRESVGKDSELQNMVDEIAGLIDSTLYKLRFLA